MMQQQMLRSGTTANSSGFPFKRPSATKVGQKKLSSSIAKSAGYSSVMKQQAAAADNLSNVMVFNREHFSGEMTETP
jgi:hypothetical protein